MDNPEQEVERNAVLSADELLAILRTARQEAISVIREAVVTEARNVARVLVKDLIDAKSPHNLNSLDVVANIQYLRGVVESMLSEKNDVKAMARQGRALDEKATALLNRWSRAEHLPEQLDRIHDDIAALFDACIVLNARLNTIHRKLRPKELRGVPPKKRPAIERLRRGPSTARSRRR